MTALQLVSGTRTISSEVVGATALVASSRAWSTDKSSTGSESATESTTRSTKTTAHTWNRTRTSWAWARALKTVSTYPAIYHSNNIQPNVLVVQSCSIDHWYQHRSIEELGNRPERVQDPGNDSTALPRWFLGEGIHWIRVLLCFY